MSIQEASIDELEAALAAGARLVDVREENEYHEKHIVGARLVALSTLADNIDAFRGESPAYVVCRSGGRSMKACELLADHGVEAINVAGGTLAWLTSGRPAIAGPNPG